MTISFFPDETNRAIRISRPHQAAQGCFAMDLAATSEATGVGTESGYAHAERSRPAVLE